MSVFRDWSPPRPNVPIACCPSCNHTYPRSLVAASGPVRCGAPGCGTVFALRAGVIVALYGPVAASEATPADLAAEKPAPVEVASRRRRRGDAPTSTRSVRASDGQFAEWQEMADAAGVPLNTWVRRSLDEAAALERANTVHPDGVPASKATP